MNTDFNNSLPIWIQLASRLKERIVTGEYPPGSHFPSVRDLARSEGVNPNTMQRVLTRLEAEGLIITNRTSGRVVTDETEILDSTRSKLASERTESFIKDMKALGYSFEAIKRFVEKGAENG